MAQRDFKFRLWNTQDKRWEHVGNKELCLTLDCKNGQLHYNGGDVVMQQWSGLQDKNGVDIFEGDILTLHPNEEIRLKLFKKDNPDSYIAICHWHEGRGFSFDLYGKYGGEGSVNYHRLKDLKVIGNIFQHNHLL